MKKPIKLALAASAASLLPLSAALAQVNGGASPMQNSDVLQNRNSTAADVNKSQSNGNISSNAARAKEASAREDANGKLAALGANDRKFVIDASNSNATEIEASRLALSSSSNASVKKFAEQMVKDHQQLGDELNATLQKAGIDPPRAEPSDEQLALLKSLRGSAFDQAYIQHIALDEHRNAVEVFSDESTKGASTALKKVATQALPKIKHHYEMGQQLAKSEGKGSK